MQPAHCSFSRVFSCFLQVKKTQLKEIKEQHDVMEAQRREIVAANGCFASQQMSIAVNAEKNKKLLKAGELLFCST